MAFAYFVIGAVLGIMVNWFVDNNGLIKRSRSPFFCLRHLLVELGLGIFLAWDYSNQFAVLGCQPLPWFESIGHCNLSFVRELVQSWQLGVIVAVHLFLVIALLAASLIDLDDYIIPDSINIPAVVIGFLVLVLCPFVVELPIRWVDMQGSWNNLTRSGMVAVSFDAADYSRPLRLFGLSASMVQFLIMVGCWTLWAFATLDRRWPVRFGFRIGAAIFWRHLRRCRLNYIIATIYLLGLLAISALCYWNPAPIKSFETIYRGLSVGPPIAVTVCVSPVVALFTGLIGMAVGLTITWVIRLIGHWALQEEALGFGDVIFMGTIGLFLGWQGALITFFIAPFIGLLFGIVRAIARMKREIPYGPALAMAAIIFLGNRTLLLEWTSPLWLDPMLLLILFGGGFLLMAIMLAIWAKIKQRMVA